MVIMFDTSKPQKIMCVQITLVARRPHIFVANRPQKCIMLDLGTNQHGDHGNM